MESKAHHQNHHAMMVKDFKKRFIISLLVTVPILLLSPSVQNWLGIQFLFRGQGLSLFILASIIVVYGARPFYLGAIKELKNGLLGMMVLVTLAVGAGYLYSIATTFFIDAPDFYWEISTLVVFLLFGHWMEMRSVLGASGALKELVKLIPPTANLLQSGEVVQVKTSALQVGDIVLVRPGEKVPIDGNVIDGNSNVNESMITGESKPVSKKKGATVLGGTLNIDGAIKIKVTKIGKDTALSQIIQLVQQAQSSKPKTQALADRAAHYLTLTAIIVGGLTLFIWTIIVGETFLFALTLMITVIVITCPHALGLAIPIVTTVTTSLAAKNGILIKDMKGLESIKGVTHVIFDKTGTLTEGRFGVSEVVKIGDWSQEQILGIAASIDQHSEHVIAQSIVRAAKSKKISIVEPNSFNSVVGKGVQGEVNGEKVFVGNKALLEQFGVSTADVHVQAKKMAEEGKTVIYVATDERVQGLIMLSDIIKPESFEALKKLKSLGLNVVMLTGDNQQTASFVAGELGVDNFFAEVLPGDKSSKVEEIQRSGGKVLMVGDGVNDAPALTQADVGVAIGAGTDVAIASAEIVLVKSNPLDIVKLIQLSRKTWSKMKQNLFWATGYNIVAIPLAAGVLYSWGIILRPEWGALAMSASSVIVVANALLLRKTNLTNV